MDQQNRDVDWMGAYLEWSHEGAPAGEAPAASLRLAEDFITAYLEWMDERPQDAAWGGIDRQHLLLETILLMALRTESECIHLARDALDTVDAAPQTVKTASEALGYAEKLLQDEGRAWRAVHSDFGSTWPHALESIQADVRSLSGKVFALQPH